MKRAIAIITMIAWGASLHAQSSVERVLAEVERNNTTLAAHRLSAEAQVAGSRTGLLPQNPEVELSHLWGYPSGLGNRTDISIRQSFDFPTAYAHRARIAEMRGQQANLEYERQRREVLYQTRLVCARLIYHNALSAQLRQRHQQALRIAEAYQVRLNTGDAGVLEYNMARVNLLTLAKELESYEIERVALLSGLVQLNGGIPIDFIDSLFAEPQIPLDFGQWHAQVEQSNPTLKWFESEAAIAERQVRLTNALNLPKLNAGYMSESVAGQRFQGVTVGVSIPLWENRGASRYARAQAQALQSVGADTRHQLYSSLKAAHAKVLALQASVAGFREQLAAHSNHDLLGKAFERGQISLAEYMLGLSLHHEGERRLLGLEMDLHLAMAELLRHQ